MIKLRKIISHLDEDVYKGIEDILIKNKADNFLDLLKSYRSNVKDDDVINRLKLNSNSFYVLKSRLYDKIQHYLSGDIYKNREELLKKMQLIPEMCLKEPREVAAAFLQKLEKDLLQFDMHNELLVVYSALKKIHLYSEKHFHYSQLFNKHIAYSLSLEKSEEILGNFNRVLGQYDFSKSQKHLETLRFLHREINSHYALNKSRQVEIIKNLIELQIGIFYNTELNKELDVEEILTQTNKIFSELPDSAPHKAWLPVLEHLFFEYYYKTGNTKNASSYYTKVNENLHSLLLYSNISCTSRFLVSGISFMQEQCKINDITSQPTEILRDADDAHSLVLLGLYNAMICYYNGNNKEAAHKLNTVLSENSFKDFFHINTDIKLTLAFVYLQMREYDLADSLLKGIYRKIKAEKIENYSNVLDLIKVFELDMKQDGDKKTAKQKDYFALFMARNTGETKVLTHLIFELKKKY